MLNIEKNVHYYEHMVQTFRIAFCLCNVFMCFIRFTQTAITVKGAMSDTG